jgi:RNA polymerase sigma factor (sigma-70 family)
MTEGEGMREMVDSVTEGSSARGSTDFDSFYGETRDRIYRGLTLALGDIDLAIEATDEAMTRAVAAWDEICHYSNPSGWVYRVGVNWGRSVQRRRLRRPVETPPPTAYDMEVPDLAITAAVAALPLRYRTVIVARYYLQWTPGEIAEAMHLPGGTVRSRLKRALDRLRSEVGEQ